MYVEPTYQDLMKSADTHIGDSAGPAKCELAVEVLRSFGRLRFAATGWSMLPSIRPGETLMVEKVSPDHVSVGDVVLVGSEGKLRAHRVVGTTGEQENRRWITQGDALAASDHPVPANELLGRVTYLIRAGKLVALPAKLGAIDNLIAGVVRRSTPAARAFVYLNRIRQV